MYYTLKHLSEALCSITRTFQVIELRPGNGRSAAPCSRADISEPNFLDKETVSSDAPLLINFQSRGTKGVLPRFVLVAFRFTYDSRTRDRRLAR